MELTQEERERIEKEAIECASIEVDPIFAMCCKFGFIKGATSNCLKKNEEIERLMNKLIEWQHIASDMQKSSREFESKLQASEERVNKMEEILQYAKEIIIAKEKLEGLSGNDNPIIQMIALILTKQ